MCSKHYSPDLPAQDLVLEKKSLLIISNLKFNTMSSLLYTVAVILIIIWAISYFGGFYQGGLIHILLVIAVIAVILRVISGNRPV